jgi:hypothetical protein
MAGAVGQANVQSPMGLRAGVVVDDLGSELDFLEVTEMNRELGNNGTKVDDLIRTWFHSRKQRTLHLTLIKALQ